MNVVLLSSHDTFGGAAKSAYRLFKALESETDLSCKMIVRHKHSRDSNVIKIGSDKSISAKLKRFNKNKFRFNRLGSLKSQHRIPWFSDNFSDVNLLDCNELRECDVINVHWTSEFAPLINVLSSFPDKKIIVTLHDQHHFTGGCHYDLGCDKFFSKCFECPQSEILGIRDRTEQVFEVRKKKYADVNFQVIAPSEWLYNLAKSSRLFKGKEVHNIPYGLNLDKWKAYSKKNAREELGLPVNKHIILSGSVNPVNYVKGGDLLQNIQVNIPDVINDRIVSHVTFGNKHESFSDEVNQFGYVDDHKTMNLLYSAADVFCITSRFDNLPNTVLEAMASGTPVIGFDIGGVPDMIEDTKTGYLVPPYSIVEFIEKIKDFLLMPVEVKMEMSYRSRKRIEENFSSERQVREYLKIFNSD
jgi:glycosyltransferase involved in cell wall biosynthesis